MKTIISQWHQRWLHTMARISRMHFRETLNQREKILFGLAISGVAILGGKILWWDAMSERSALQTEWKQLEQQKNNLERFVFLRETMSGQKDDRKQKLFLDFALLPEALDTFFHPLLVKNLKITQFTTTDVEDHETWKSQNVSLELSGAYADIQAYVERLKRLRFVFVIERIVVSPVLTSTSSIKASITGRIYGRT